VEIADDNDGGDAKSAGRDKDNQTVLGIVSMRMEGAVGNAVVAVMS
jgi:hypothetical protein